MPGKFIAPEPSLHDLEAPHEQLGITIHSGYQAMQAARQFCGHSRIFDAIAERLQNVDMP